MPDPRVTVVVPVYNLESLVAEALQSLMAQTYPDFEAIIVDDGSTDGTADAVKPFLADERFHYVFQQNQKLGAARNTALRIARGEWFALLDGDDIWLPHKLETQLHIADSDPRINLVYGNAIVFHEDGREYLYYQNEEMREGDITAWQYEANHLAGLTVMVKTEDLRAVGGFDEKELVEDYAAWLRLVQRGVWAGVCRAPVARYRIRAGSLTSNYVRTRLRKIEVLDECLKRETRPRYAAILRRSIARVRGEVGRERMRQAVISGDPQIERYLWEWWRADPRRVKTLVRALLCTLSAKTGVDLGRRAYIERIRGMRSEWELARSDGE